MSAQTQIPSLTFEELLDQEERSEIRREYIGGQLYAMAGGMPLHADIVANLAYAVQSRLRGKPFRGTSSEQRVRTSDTAVNWYYPDYTIKCPPSVFHPRDPNSLINPSALFEVLSPGTEVFDRTGKFDEYKLIESLSDYILIDTGRTRVEHFTRLSNGQWSLSVYTQLDQELALSNFEISVPLSEIYEDVTLPVQPVLPPSEEKLEFTDQ